MSWWKRLKFWDRERVSVEVAFPSESELNRDVAGLLLKDLIQERISNRRWTLLKRVAITLLFLIGLGSYAYFYAKFEGWSFVPREPLLGVVRVTGQITDKSVARADKVIPALKAAFEAENVKAVAILIDSPGGAPVEAERINNAVALLREEHKKPVYAVIGNLGASAAYMIAMHADEIYAGRYSLVGSIGAVLASWDVHKALARFDIYQHVYASGELKAMLNPFTEPTPEAAEKAQSLVSATGRRFHDELVDSRGSKLEKGRGYDSGEVWGGEEAQRLGLVDQLGTLETLEARLEEKFGELLVHDFGPRGPAQLPLAAAISATLREALVGSIREVGRGAALR